MQIVSTLKFSDTTSYVHTISIFVTADLPSISYIIHYIGMFIDLFSYQISGASLFVILKVKAKENVCMAAMFLVYIIIKISQINLNCFHSSFASLCV